MVAPRNLMGLGMPARQAELIGLNATNKAGSGTTQTGATQLTSNLTVATTASGQTAFIMRSGFAGAGPVIFINTSSTSALLFPPVGGSISGGAANAAFTVPQNRLVELYCSDGSNNWFANLSS